MIAYLLIALLVAAQTYRHTPLPQPAGWAAHRRVWVPALLWPAAVVLTVFGLIALAAGRVGRGNLEAS